MIYTNVLMNLFSQGNIGPLIMIEENVFFVREAIRVMSVSVILPLMNGNKKLKVLVTSV